MGLEYKKRIKEQYGRKAVVGYDVANLGGSLVAASVSDQILADANSVSHYVVNRPAKLDGLTLQVTPQLVAASGALTVRALIDGTPVGTGTIPAGQAYGDVMFETESSRDVSLASGNVLTLDASKDATPSGVNISVRALLRLLER